ncbi:MAG: hypothetical protein ABJC79_15010 [Acidimicrobiia bacterium]
MADSKGRAGRLRAIALALLVAGVALGFLVGAAFPAEVGTASPSLSKVTNYTSSTESGDGSFNWLFTILVIGPALVASSVVYASAEIVAGLRRSGRSRTSEPVVTDGTGTV